jgi:hypothetical protein
MMKKFVFAGIIALLLSPIVADAASLAVTNPAAMAGTNYGLAVTFTGDTAKAYVKDETPDGETIYRAQFWFDPASVNMADRTYYVLFRATRTTPMSAAVMILHKYVAGTHRIWLRGLNNPLTVRFSTRIDLMAGSPSLLQVEWTQGDTPGVLSGNATLTVLDGYAAGQSVGIDLNNSDFVVDDCLLGAVGNVPATSTGTIYVDEFASYRTLAP